MPEAGARTIGKSGARKPRAHVEYEVFTLGAKKMVELPFVMGVMSDLSGKPKNPQPSVKDRAFDEIGAAGLAPLFKKYRPRVAMPVPNRLANDGSSLLVDMEFESMDDFLPDRVARKTEATRLLLEQRERLADLLSYLDGKEDAEKLVAEILEKVRALTEKPS